ncbi:MAG: hypothetical protein ACLQOO_12885 [Terriglobia bacterium]
MARWTTSLFPLFVLLSVTSCSHPLDLKRDVQREFDSNPKLKERGIAVKVVRIENGYVTANIERGFSPKTRKAINDGHSLNEIYFFTDTSVNVLIESEEIVKKKPGIKAVMWTATVPREASNLTIPSFSETRLLSSALNRATLRTAGVLQSAP